MQLISKIKDFINNGQITKRAMVLFVSIFFIGFLIVGALAKEGIENIVEGYRLSRERLNQPGLPQEPDSDDTEEDQGLINSLKETLGLLPKKKSINSVSGDPEGEELPGEVEFSPEEQKKFIEISQNIIQAQDSIKKISDLIAEAVVDMIIDANKGSMSVYFSDKIITDYPAAGKVMTSSDLQSFLTPAITDAFKTESLKTFLTSELQTLIDAKITDLVGPNASADELTKAVNDNLSKIVMENLPSILKKPTAFDPLSDKIYTTLNSLPVFDTSFTGKTVSNMAGDMTYTFDCQSNGAVTQANGPTSATANSISSICYYFRSSNISLQVAKDNAGTANGSAAVAVANDSLTITPVNQSPIIDVGSDKTVTEGSSVTLSGARSVDPEGGALIYSWIQTSGTAVSFSSSSPTISFTAPMLGQDEEGEDILSGALGFQLTITDNRGASASGSVSVAIIKDTPPDQTDTPRQYFAAVISGSSLGKVDFLNRIMGGGLKQFSQAQTKYYLENNFTVDEFGISIKDNTKEMAVDVTKSTFNQEFITDIAEGQPKPVGRGIYRDKKPEDRRGPEDLGSPRKFEFDADVLGSLFRTIQGYGSCRKSWHFKTRCNCRCSGKSYLWDPLSRTCGCGK